MTHEKKIKPLGVVLKEKGLITDEYIGYALQEQKITQEKIGEIFSDSDLLLKTILLSPYPNKAVFLTLMLIPFYPKRMFLNCSIKNYVSTIFSSPFEKQTICWRSRRII